MNLGFSCDTVGQPRRKPIYGYRSGYCESRPIIDQVALLQRVYPQLKEATIDGPSVLPEGAEGLFAIPNIWKSGSSFEDSYNTTLMHTLNWFERNRVGVFHNYRKGQLNATHLQEVTHSKNALRRLSEKYGHPDILVIACQFGIQYRGMSVMKSREVMINRGQFGLGAFVISAMLFTHPERLQHSNDLWIDCAGDEYKPDSNFEFNHNPVFEHHIDNIIVRTSRSDTSSPRYGSASGFFC